MADNFPTLKAAMHEVLASHGIPMPLDTALRISLSNGLDAKPAEASLEKIQAIYEQ